MIKGTWEVDCGYLKYAVFTANEALRVEVDSFNSQTVVIAHYDDSELVALASLFINPAYQGANTFSIRYCG